MQVRKAVKRLIERRLIEPHPLNAHVHPERQREAVRASLAEFGFVGCVLVRPLAKGGKTQRFQCLDGHERVGQFKPREKVPCLVVELTDEEARKFLAVYDRTTDLAEWDAGLLRELMEGVEFETEGLDALVAGAIGEAEELLAEREREEEREIIQDEVPDPPKKPTTKPGDLWLLGDHRLLCGDSTNADDVARVMNGERAGLMNTDPPYGIAYDNASGIHPDNGPIADVILNDQFTDEELQAFLESAFCPAIDAALQPRAAWYLWHAMLTQGFFAAAAAAAAAANVVLHRQIIWIKNRLVFGRGQYHWKHELAFFGWVDGHQPPDYGRGNGERDQTTVWEIAGVRQDERRKFNHSTPKPVKLFAIPIVKHLKPGEIAYEPFAGSGPQFIAAEQLGRRCYGLEIDPAYCDVIVKRWENLTGKKATKG